MTFMKFQAYVRVVAARQAVENLWMTRDFLWMPDSEKNILSRMRAESARRSTVDASFVPRFA